MNPHLLTLILALAAAGYLAYNRVTRPFGIVGAVAVGLDLLIVVGVLSLGISGIDLRFIFALAMVIGGGGSWLKGAGKLMVTAATGLTIIGVVRLLTYV